MVQLCLLQTDIIVLSVPVATMVDQSGSPQRYYDYYHALTGHLQVVACPHYKCVCLANKLKEWHQDVGCWGCKTFRREMRRPLNEQLVGLLLRM